MSPHAPNSSETTTATIAGQLPKPAARHSGIRSTERLSPSARGTRNWSTHITTVAQGSAIADQPATLKKPFSMCGNVATTAPSHSAPNSEYLTVALNAGPKSKGPAPEIWAIIQPPMTNRTRPTASATTYGSAGQKKRGLPQRQVSGSLPHMTEPMARLMPDRKGSGPRSPTGGVAERTSPEMSVNP